MKFSRVLLLTCFCLSAIVWVGCAQEGYYASNKTVDSSERSINRNPSEMAGDSGPNQVNAPSDFDLRGGVELPSKLLEEDLSKQNQSKNSTEQEASPSKQSKRKIIYTANISIVVEDFSGIPEAIKSLVEKHEGYVSSENRDRMQGEQRSGNWTIRIPVENYQKFLESAGDLGVPSSLRQNAQDVTEEFFDVQARIGNKKKLEARILELLDRPDDKIQHVIEVERELARVREDIERMEGRIRFLKDQTSMTTVSLQVREEKNYQPPQVPTLSNRISSAWNNSLSNFKTFCEDALVYIVANAIGILIGLVGIIIGLLFLRIVWKRITRPSSA